MSDNHTLAEAYAAAKAGKKVSNGGHYAEISHKYLAEPECFVWTEKDGGPERVQINEVTADCWTIEEPQPEYEDCEIVGDFLCYIREVIGMELHEAINDPDFIGYVYDGDKRAVGYPVAYKDIRTGELRDSECKNDKPVRPTHVRFKKG